MVFAIFVTFSLASAIVPAQSHAQKFKVLHTFNGSDGANPIGQLIRDATGNIYGTTGEGGSGKCKGALGCGTAFKMNKDGKLIWQDSFRRASGAGPYAGLLRDAAGNLFGITEIGGDNSCYPSYGCGTVFKLTKTGKETVLHKFTDVPDGEFPQSPLIEDPAGILYGTTYLGGAYEYGSVFSVTISGQERVLYSFTGGPDGGIVHSGVIRDASGNLYGVTGGGGAYGGGVVFELDTTGKETVLYSFTGESDGGGPVSELIADAAGNLYGLTAGGGNLECGGGDGCGVVFELSPHSGEWMETTLYTFCSLSNCADGRRPTGGPLALDHAGNLYGTTQFGGTSRCGGSDGCGVVFKLDTTGKEIVLHSFTGGADGKYPFKGLTTDLAGNLYGAALQGGSHGYGTLFKITP